MKTNKTLLSISTRINLKVLLIIHYDKTIILLRNKVLSLNNVFREYNTNNIIFKTVVVLEAKKLIDIGEAIK